jgi:hypothetical protein
VNYSRERERDIVRGVKISSRIESGMGEYSIVKTFRGKVEDRRPETRERTPDDPTVGYSSKQH